jgi:hypothetical protein
MKYNNVINVLCFNFLSILSIFWIISKIKKRKNLEDIYFMCFIFGIPAPLVRKKERKKEKYLKTIVINDLHFMFSGRKKQMKTTEAPEC